MAPSSSASARLNTYASCMVRTDGAVSSVRMEVMAVAGEVCSVTRSSGPRLGKQVQELVIRAARVGNVLHHQPLLEPVGITRRQLHRSHADDAVQGTLLE